MPVDWIKKNMLTDIKSDIFRKRIILNSFFLRKLSDDFFHRLRQFVPSLLSDCPSLRVVFYHSNNCFIKFPADDSAAASDEQSVAKWLFTARPDNVPKVFNCILIRSWKWALRMTAFKAAFASASSPANFIVVIFIHDISPFVEDRVVPFDQTNELTREQLALKRTDNSNRFVLVRCPIARDESKWTKWEKEAIGWQFYDQWNRINIRIDDESEIDDGLLDATPGPSDQQQK